MARNGRLRRVLSLPTLTLYGLGTMVGGGFYALVGKVAGEAGSLAPLAFLVSAIVALLSALSYAELASRFPVSACEARYIREGLGRSWLSRAAGWGVALTGVVSAA
ncbi:MAG: amino acid transporter, partial [Phycisphaerales bacterium JB059]